MTRPLAGTGHGSRPRFFRESAGATPQSRASLALAVTLGAVTIDTGR